MSYEEENNKVLPVAIAYIKSSPVAKLEFNGNLIKELSEIIFDDPKNTIIFIDHMIMAKFITSPAMISHFDPISRVISVRKGLVGSLFGCQVYTDAYEYMEHRFITGIEIRVKR